MSTRLVRFAADGGEAWTADIEGAGPLYSFGLYATPDGFAAGQYVFTSPQEIRVYWFGAGGSSFGRTTTTGAGGCEVVFSQPVPSGVDAAGAVHVGVTQSNGPSSCAKGMVFRFRPYGEVEAFPLPLPDRSIVRVPQALDVGADGGVSVVYGERIARIDPDGTRREGIGVAAGAVLTGVAAGPSTQTFVAGHEVTPEAPGLTPFAGGYSAGAGYGGVALPRLGGVSTEAGPVALDGRTGYVALHTTVDPVSVAAVSQVSEAIPVPGHARPPVAGALLAAVGPTPVRAGAPVRVRLGAPARLALYDALGRRVATWEAASGMTAVTAPLAAGVYVLRAEAGGETASARIVVVR